MSAASTAVTRATSVMSAPATKALPPAPVRITPRTEPSSRASSNAVRRSRMVFALRALSTFGRLMVTEAIAPFFSYRTVSSVAAVAVELIPNSLHECAEAADGLANDQVLHLVGAFVGVERLRIREEAADTILHGDAVASADLPRPRDRLAALGRAERLGDRRMRVRQLAFLVQLRHARHHALAGGDVADHLGEEFLNHLKRGDRLAELLPLLRVLERVLVRAHLAAGRHPCHGVARDPQDPRRVAERHVSLEAVCFRHAAIFPRDVAVLNHLQRHLVRDLLVAESRCRFVLDDEGLDLVVGEVSRPDDRNVTPG